MGGEAVAEEEVVEMVVTVSMVSHAVDLGAEWSGVVDRNLQAGGRWVDSRGWQ